MKKCILTCLLILFFGILNNTINACSYGDQAVYNETNQYVFKAKVTGLETKQKSDAEMKEYTLSQTVKSNLKAYYTVAINKIWHGNLGNINKVLVPYYTDEKGLGGGLCIIQNLEIGKDYIFLVKKDSKEDVLVAEGPQDVELVIDSNVNEIISYYDSVFKDTWGNINQWAILALKYREVVNGYSDGLFRPNETITREQLAKFIVNNFKFQVIESGNQFPDLTSDNKFYKYILTLKNMGIISGYSDGKFHGERYVTKGEAAKFVKNSLKLFAPKLYEKENNSKSEFIDVAQNNVFYREIIDLEMKNIIYPYETNYHYYPDNNIKRHEIAAMMENAYEKGGGYYPLNY